MTNDGTQPDQPLFRLPSLILLVVANMIGTGVFTTSGYTLATVGSPFRVLVCWCIGGFIAICGAVAYGRLARILPHSGGEYLYLTNRVHPVAGFLAGWVSLTAGFSGAIAASAVAFEAYALPDSIRPAWLPADLVAIAVVVLCGLAHGRHQGMGRTTQNVIVAVKLLCLAAFLAFALPLVSDSLHRIRPADVPPRGLQLVFAMATSVVWISLSYAGFNSAVYVASESEHARRTVPKALVAGTIGVTVIYLLLNFVFVASTEPSALMNQQDIAAVAAHAVGGQWLEGLVRLVISLALLTSVSGMVIAGPRVYVRMADDGVFPTILRSSAYGTRLSVTAQSAIAVGLIVMQKLLVSAGVLESSLLGLLIYVSTTLSLSSALCVATIFRRNASAIEPPMSPFTAVAAAVYTLATLTAIVLLVFSHSVDGRPRGLWHISGAALTVVSGLIAYRMLMWQRKQ